MLFNSVFARSGGTAMKKWFGKESPVLPCSLPAAPRGRRCSDAEVGALCEGQIINPVQ